MTAMPRVLRSMMFAAAALVSLSSQAALAGDAAPYQAAEFSAAQEQQKHVIVEVFKKGCPTCAAQQPALEKARMEYPDAVFMKVDFQNDDVAVSKFKAVMQSTIIVFKGKTEVARLVGETDEKAILGAIAKGA